MSEPTEGVWRDEQALPLSELTQAMATYSQDGQVDDLTGEEAAAEEEYGHGPQPDASSTDPASDPESSLGEGRRLRPSPDGTSPSGRTEPN
jgi:hypothetical protein